MACWDNISSVQMILVLDKAEAIHQLYFRNLASSMGIEVVFDLLLCGISRKIPNVKAGQGYVGHLGGQPSRQINLRKLSNKVYFQTAALEQASWSGQTRVRYLMPLQGLHRVDQDWLKQRKNEG